MPLTPILKPSVSPISFNSDLCFAKKEIDSLTVSHIGVLVSISDNNNSYEYLSLSDTKDIISLALFISNPEEGSQIINSSSTPML